MPDHFDGDGFDKSPIDGDEAAKVRHMFHSVDKHWSTLSSVGTVVSAIGILSTAIKFGLPVLAAMAVLGAALKAAEWL